MKVPPIEEIEAEMAIVKTHCLKEKVVQRFLAIYLSQIAKKADIIIPVEVMIALLKEYITITEASLNSSLEKARKIHEEASKKP